MFVCTSEYNFGKCFTAGCFWHVGPDHSPHRGSPILYIVAVSWPFYTRHQQLPSPHCPTCDNQICLQTLPDIWEGIQSPFVKNHWFRIERDMCTPMFISALFIITKTWKQPRCPSADEWIRKLWYIYTMEYYSAIQKNTFESVLMRWMKLKPIIQSEVSQKKTTPIQYTNA